MNQLSRAAMKLTQQTKTAQWIKPAIFTSPKLFSTEAADETPSAADDRSPQTPLLGSIYARVGNITKHTSKSDIMGLLGGCGLKPDNLKIEYDRFYNPLSMMVEFSSSSRYDHAVKQINKKGRMFKLGPATKVQWESFASFDGKAIFMKGIPITAVVDDINRFFTGCQYYDSDIEMYTRFTNEGRVKVAVVRFPSHVLAMHAFVTKNGSFCLNDRVSMQVLY